jgi:hypothetical protein
MVFELQRERYIAAQASNQLHPSAAYGIHISGKRIPRENHTERVQLYKHSAFAGSMIFLNENRNSRGRRRGVAVLDNCCRMVQTSPSVTNPWFSTGILERRQQTGLP